MFKKKISSHGSLLISLQGKHIQMMVSALCPCLHQTQEAKEISDTPSLKNVVYN